MKYKNANDLSVDDVVAHEFGGGVGCQWALVVKNEVGDFDSLITLRLPARFGYRQEMVTMGNAVVFPSQTREEYERWIRTMKINENALFKPQ